jgi:hypothetical protein
MQQLLLSYLTCLVVKDRNLLKAGMEIAAYNQHRWLLFSGLLIPSQEQITAERSQRCYEIKRSEATVCFVKLLIRAAARIMEKWKPKNGFHFPTIPAATAVSRFRNKLRSDAVGGFRVLSH